MREKPLSEHQPLGLCVEPDATPGQPRDAAALAAWLADHRAWLDERLDRHGAVLFRGFGVNEPARLEAVSQAVGQQAMDYVGGASPRDRIQNKVYESTYTNRRLPLPLHSELSYLQQSPARVYFACQTEPGAGGQTPLVDMAEVYDRIDPTVRDAFEQHGVLLVQTLPPSRRRLAPKSWPDMFETTDRQQAQARAEEVGYQVTWTDRGSMRLTSHCRAVIRHPRSGRMVWFNQAHLFHQSWSWELKRVGLNALAMLLRLREWAQRRRRSLDQQHVQAALGDGSPLDRKTMLDLRELLWRQSVQFDWQQGDLLILDNLRVGHGRNPYRPPRMILVTMTDPTDLGPPPGIRPSPTADR